MFWAASDVGWVVGHSYIVYAPLLHGCTTILYEGKPVGTPDAGAFWRVIAEHGVRTLFTAPTAFRAIKREDPDGALPAAATTSRRFARCSSPASAPIPTRCAGRERTLGVPVIDHWWQTETGWAIAANCLGHRARCRSSTARRRSRCPATTCACSTPAGSEVAARRDRRARHQAAAAARLPADALERRRGFLASYLSAFPGYYQTADAGYLDEDGYLFVMARTDDIINVAGHRLSTGAMEEVLAAHPDVAECAVVGVADELKGQVPLGLRRAEGGRRRASPTRSRASSSQLVRDRIGAGRGVQATRCVVKRLPKTRSGKILRGTMRQIADGETYDVPATIDDPAILDEIAAALVAAGLPPGRTRLRPPGRDVDQWA